LKEQQRKGKAKLSRQISSQFDMFKGQRAAARGAAGGGAHSATEK
jgi:hypothetical protein